MSAIRRLHRCLDNPHFALNSLAFFTWCGRPVDMDTDVAKAVDLFAAVQNGDVDRVRALLPPYGEPVVEGPPAAPGGLTPLMIAAAGGHETAVELLLRCGAVIRRGAMHGAAARRSTPAPLAT